MVQLNPDAYIGLDEAARRLRVPPHYLQHVLDLYGLSPQLIEAVGRQVTIRAGDLRTIRRLIKDETHHRGAA